MSAEQIIDLEPIRTDGWFERIGDSVGSFQALCEIVGERFFAFSMITGARITALTVDRRNPENTLVDFVVDYGEEEVKRDDVQRLTLAEFRRRLVSALVMDDPAGPAPKRATDTEAVQLHLGVRYLLLAPLYGYTLLDLLVSQVGSTIRVLHDGVEETYTLTGFRDRIKGHVREELSRVARPGRGAIDLSHVKEAEEAATKGDHQRVAQLLGQWPGPLTIFLRTPEGQLLNAETRGIIAKGLGLLGSACVHIGDSAQGEEVLRLAVQYAGEGATAGEMYARLGEALLDDHRPGEAIAPLRRAANLGAPGDQVWPLLARAFSERGRAVAAFAAILEARAAGVEEAVLAEVTQTTEESLGEALRPWRALMGSTGPGPSH